MSGLDLLPDLAGAHHDARRCRYHWHDRSDRLVVTIGDSWTYGMALDPWHHRDHYGRLMSDDLDHAWMNFGCRGGSNSWSINILLQIIDWLNQSRYIQGKVIVTMTENGRDVNEGRSRPFDYSVYRDHPVALALFDRVLDDVEQEWIHRLRQARQHLHPRFRLVIGSNFCWHQKLFESLVSEPGVCCVAQNWIECLPGDPEVPRIRTTNTQWPLTLLDMLGHQDRSVYQDWVLAADAEILALWQNMRSRRQYFPPHDPGHPNAAAHRIWADALLAVI